MSTAQTVYAPTERQRWFRDGDGVASTTKRADEIVGLPIDWSRELESGETISSVAYSDSGVTRSSVSNTTTTTTCNVSGTGETKITLTLSTGRKIQRLFRFRDAEGSGASDYGD